MYQVRHFNDEWHQNSDATVARCLASSGITGDSSLASFSAYLEHVNNFRSRYQMSLNDHVTSVGRPMSAWRRFVEHLFNETDWLQYPRDLVNQAGSRKGQTKGDADDVISDEGRQLVEFGLMIGLSDVENILMWNTTFMQRSGVI